ncbi:hypothetical protein J4447_04845 [Candidatus Pacearchaeota archaeon]|nr:hypothetical protein [Candidatus Pacearchaeota archaeon]
MEKQNKSSLSDISYEKWDKEFVAQIVIVAILALLLAYNFGRSGTGTSGTYSSGSSANILPSVSAAEIVPSGTPAIYGDELGVKYDDINPSNQRLADATIEKLSSYEGEVLSEEFMERYIIIGSSISCEYCCGAEALIFSNGERACGCAHSYSMRGLAKYLLMNHGDEMTDLQILEELGKWKVLFFPGIHMKKAAVLKANNIDHTDYVNLASNKYRGIEEQALTSSGSSGGMVGGC